MSLHCDYKSPMETNNAAREQTIRRVVTAKPDAIVDVTVALWQHLSSELISIIGDIGFQSLYSRSIHRTAASNPWIMILHGTRPASAGFADMKLCFEDQIIAEACEASISLLTIFLDILIALIGEHLTTSILRSAWGDDAVHNVVKELR